MARPKLNKNGNQLPYHRPYLFRSYYQPKTFPEDNLGRYSGTSNDHKIWQVGRATSATALYFEAMRLEEQGEMLDYIAIGSKNLIDEAYWSVQQVERSGAQTGKILVSIGTGHKLEDKPYSFLAFKRFISYTDSRSKAINQNLLAATRNYVDYFRLDGEHGLDTLAFDEWKGGETLELMRTLTEGYLKSPDVKRDLGEIAKQLVEIRRQRSTWEPDLDRWERFCHGVRYACPVSTCKDDAKRYKTRQILRDHLTEIHSIEPYKLEPLLDAGKRFLSDEVLE